MRTLMMGLIALALLAGCKVSTAPIETGTEPLRAGSPMLQPEWLYEGHDFDPPEFPPLVALASFIQGDSIVIRAYFASPPPAYGDGWLAAGSLIDAEYVGYWSYAAMLTLAGSAAMVGPRTLEIRGPAAALSFVPDATELLLIHGESPHGYTTYLGATKWLVQ